MFTWKKTQVYFLNLLIKKQRIMTCLQGGNRWLCDNYIAVCIPEELCFVTPKKEFNISSIIMPRSDVKLSFTGKSMMVGDTKKRLCDIYVLPSGQEYYFDQKLLAIIGDEYDCNLYVPENGKGIECACAKFADDGEVFGAIMPIKPNSK